MKLGLDSTKNDQTLENSTISELDEKGRLVIKCILCGGKGADILNIRHREKCCFSGVGSKGEDQTLPPVTVS